MEFTFRQLQPADIKAYRELRLQALQESSAAFSESHEDERAQPDSYFLACMGTDAEHFTVGCLAVSNQLVGVGTIKRDQRSKARLKSSIHTMYVAPNARGKGAAAEILRHLIGAARKMPGLEQIHLWVLDPQTSVARKLYLKNGFLAQGLMVCKDLKIGGKYVDAEYMTLHL